MLITRFELSIINSFHICNKPRGSKSSNRRKMRFRSSPLITQPIVSEDVNKSIERSEEAGQCPGIKKIKTLELLELPFTTGPYDSLHGV